MAPSVTAGVGADSSVALSSSSPSETSQAHFIRSGRSLAALRNQVIWMRQIRQLPGLTSEQRKQLGQMSRILVPLPQ